jgi:hypothetical protein
MAVIQSVFSGIEKEIQISQVDETDDAYRITTSSCTDDLVHSIRSLGNIHIPILFQKEPRFRIVSGFKRIEAFRRLQITEFKALILEPNTSEKICAVLSISDNSFQRALNLIEQSRALNLLSPFYPAVESLSKAASELRLPSHPVLISKIKILSVLPQSVQDAVMTGLISLPVAIGLTQMNSRISTALTELFSELKLGMNQQRELMILFQEIAFREKKDLLDIILDAGIQEIRNSSTMDGNQKTSRMKGLLIKMRFPVKTAMEEEFQSIIKKMKLGQGVSLKPPRNFEGRNFSLLFEFEDMESLKKHQTVFERIAGNTELKKLIET